MDKCANEGPSQFSQQCIYELNVGNFTSLKHFFISCWFLTSLQPQFSFHPSDLFL